MVKRFLIASVFMLFAPTAFAASWIPITPANPNPLAQNLKDTKRNPAADETDRAGIPGVVLPGINTGAGTMIGMNAAVGSSVAGSVQLRINF